MSNCSCSTCSAAPAGAEPQEITILSIIYPPEELAGGETEAYVTIRRAGEDALDYLHVPLKRVQTENMWRMCRCSIIPGTRIG